MYTWGYIKDVILAKLDLDETEALELNYLERFVFYANEAMTMICSTVKPKRTFHEFETEGNETIVMPSDFISFGDDRNTIREEGWFNCTFVRETADEDFDYLGYDRLYCYSKGKYKISYNARWYEFSVNDNDTILDIPLDVLECIPSYVASQCMKVDDEQKAAMLRNEFEILVARIDDTHYKSNKTFKIGGDW